MKLKKTLNVALASLLMSTLFSGFAQAKTNATNPISKKADVILQNGTVYTVNAKRDFAEAIAISDGKIVYVGTNQGVKPYQNAKTKVVDLGGKMVLPGFIDSHSHVTATVETIFSVNLVGKKSREDYLHTIKEFVQKNPNLKGLKGFGWENPIFPGKGPKKEDLDQIVKDIPVVLTSGDHHSVWVNSKALELAGITKDTKNPEGGVIERDDVTGEPTGTLRETAQNLVMEIIPDYSEEEYKEGILAYEQMAAEKGITSVHLALAVPGSNALNALKALEAENKLHLKYRVSLATDPSKGPSQVKSLVEERAKLNGPDVQVNSVKVFMDGVIEGGTAALIEPYKDKHNAKPQWDPQVFNETAAALDKAGFAMHVHSVGDAATKETLDGFEYAVKKNGKRDSRHQMTHLQIVQPSDIQRMEKLNVVAVANPYWFIKSPGYYENIELPYLGEERASREYPMKSLINNGVKVASASDYPITWEFDPLYGIQVGVTREEFGNTDPKLVLGPEERASVADLIASFTINGAYASFSDNITGSIEQGKEADLVVIDKNLFKIPSTEIGSAKVLLTMEAGEETFRDAMLK
ncbi:amidohydrolase [Brevibacillus brevis]|uniref:amidohydrolase n=1 Tax=Brevibacillus brevis TaxID=1393 RepID=UPI0011596FCD|nr:amidohydrolase family protein [Lysinibacillus sp. SDF0063]TQR36350.1 amidohydrolase [Lysinibacillus sp. SDF0063]